MDVSSLMRTMWGPPGLHHANRHAEAHYEYDSCTTGEPPYCTPDNPNHVVKPKPNHFFYDEVFGEPSNCTRDHNHPEDTMAVSTDVNSPRAEALDEARRLITGDRNNQYGPPTQDFTRTADLLNALGYRRVDAEDTIHDILGSDVALIIAQVKMSRLMHSRHKKDSWVDLAGYAACGYENAVEELKNDDV